MNWKGFKLNIKNTNHHIEINIDDSTGQMTTDELIYGDALQIIFDKETQCFAIKNYNKIKNQYYSQHARINKNNTFNEFLEMVI